MNYIEFKSAVISYAKAAGLTEYDLYCSSGSSTSVRAYQGEIENFSDAASIGAGFRCIVDGRLGCSYTQKLCAEEAERLVSDAMSGAEIIETTGFAVIYGGDKAYADVPQGGGGACDVQMLKGLALEMEKLAKDMDARITLLPFSTVGYSSSEVGLVNSRGLDLMNRQSEYFMHCAVAAQEGGRKYVGQSGIETLTPDGLDVRKAVKEAVELALGGIGGRSVPTGTYPVIFSNRMMCEFLGCFTGAFSGDAAQKGLSLLAGKENERVASELVTITDDPHRADYADRSPFDDEGVATFTKTLVENGVLKTLLYDLKSAARGKRASTGNGRRPGYAGDVNVAPYVFCLQPGDCTPDMLMEKAGKAIYVTELKGLHAAANPITGDFSLESKGFLVKNGRVARPAEQFIVSGNFFDVMKDITGVGNDFEINGAIGSASVLVGGLSVAGES